MTEEIQNNKDNRENLLTEQEAWNWLTFANSLSSLTGMPLTPDLVNARLRDVSLVSGVGGVTEADVTSAMSNPKESEDKLLQISESLEIASTPYKRLLHYMSNLLSFDLTYYAKNAKYEDYSSPKYQKDLDQVKRFLDNFDYKKEFATVVKQLLREETFYGVLRDEGEKYVLQQLPSNYCKITGRFDYGLLFSFNYYWFMQGGVDINFYPPIFKKTFERLFKNGKPTDYNPSIPVDLRSNSMWVLWGDCSPKDSFWAWKMSPEIATRIPYFSGMFADFSLQNLVRGLQKSSYMAEAVKFILGEVGMLNKDLKGATVKDAISISPDLLGKFMQLIKTAINSEVVRIASAPLQNMNGVEFKGNTEILSSYLRTTLGSSGINTNLLYSGDAKQNSIESQLSVDVDVMVMSQLYPTFDSFIEYHVNRKTKNFKFGFKFEGSNIYLDRQRRLDSQNQLMSLGIVNVQKLSAALGQNPFVFQAQLDEARAMGWTKNLTPIVSAFQQSANGGKPGEGEKGRPQKSDSELGEEGSNTRDSGQNIAKGGSV